ncbi:MAG: TetR/AcrR family transcriptional regulator [Acidimicrobiia bacterium]
MARGDARQQLLDAAIEYVAGHGLTDLSLRRLAAELGTSHRMLSHHFGSKEGLWVAIVHEVERRQVAAISELVPDPSASLEDAMRAWWRHISDSSLWPNERLFFEVYGQALRGRPPTSALLDGIVESWLGPGAELGEAMGVPHEDARAFARLGVAVTRGLLLDLLATEDRAGVDAAMEHWIALNTRFVDHPDVDHPDAAGRRG